MIVIKFAYIKIRDHKMNSNLKNSYLYIIYYYIDWFNSHLFYPISYVNIHSTVTIFDANKNNKNHWYKYIRTLLLKLVEGIEITSTKKNNIVAFFSIPFIIMSMTRKLWSTIFIYKLRLYCLATRHFIYIKVKNSE